MAIHIPTPGGVKKALQKTVGEAKSVAQKATAAVEHPKAIWGAWASNDSAGQRKSDPVNFYVQGNLADVVRTFQKAGWSIANSGPGANQDYAAAMKDYTAHEANALLPGVNVPQHIFHRVNRMPVGNLYLNGKPPLVSMEANNHPLSGRDHFRIFDTGKKDAQGKAIYAVTSSRDQGIKIDPNRKK